MKIIYSGIQAENYDTSRNPSFEYLNFYLTLKNMTGVEVIEYEYDRLLKISRKKFNEELIEIIKKEKPDLFFAFMYSDEFEFQTLKTIKRLTTSIAWFADDHWRLDSYSRFYAPHFTKTITTWGEGIKNYERYGIDNVIRSQWACNHNIWKPFDCERDIDVSFIGQYNPARYFLVSELRKAGINVWVRGWGWPEGRLSGKEMVRVFSRSKINLNFSTPPKRWSPKLLSRLLLKKSTNHIRPSWHFISNFRSWFNTSIPQIKARPFEILACETFLISGFADDMDQYYENKKEIIYYDGSVIDLVEKIKYYLDHPEEREKIAAASYKRTQAEHTYEKRFKEIFDKIGIHMK